MSRPKGDVITAEVLRSIVNYDPETGVFTWKIAPNRSVSIGAVACNTRTDGYLALQFQNRLYRAHRLAWLYMTGDWPTDSVDHINRVKSDNRWANLRPASSLEQTANRAVRNAVGIKGVVLCEAKVARPFRAVGYHHGGRHVHLGYFATAEEAGAAYRRFIVERDGEFACLDVKAA